MRLKSSAGLTLLLALGCNSILGNDEGFLVDGSNAGGSDSPSTLEGGESPGGASASSSSGTTGEGGEPGASSGAPGDAGGAGSAFTAGATGEGGSNEAGSGGSAVSGGAGGAGGAGGRAGAGGTGVAGAGGAGGAGVAGAAGAGGAPPTGPYAPRSGSFKILLYSKTAAFRHGLAITAGKSLIQTIAAEKGFTVVATETNEEFTTAGLAQYEIVFFLNTTGDVLTAAEQTVFEDWMKTKDGAWAGVHSAADTEQAWNFYHELTGQQYTDHTNGPTPGQINWQPAHASHPILLGLPSPWALTEEWWNFPSTAWQTKPGFQILGRKASDGQPIIWARESSNFRSFYSGLGHDASSFMNADVKTLLTNAILWTVRREHLL